MKKRNTGIIIFLAIAIVALAAGNIVLYMEGKQTVKHVEVKEAEKIVEEEYPESISDSMEGFFVSYDMEDVEMETSAEDMEEISEENMTEKELEEEATEEDMSEEGQETSEYIFPNSDSAYLKKKDLKGMTAKELRLARNELYARHGYIFNDEELSEYFNSKSWYKEQIAAEDFADKKHFNKYEKANRDLIKKVEKKK